MKKLLSINIGIKGFRNEHDAATEKLGLEATVMRSKHCYFVIRDGNAVLFHKNEEINPTDYGYVFIRVAGRFAHMTSLIAQYFKFHSVPLSDKAYLEHTHNEEKITQMLLFGLNTIAIPNTILFPRQGFEENKESILNTITFPCVLKTNGSQGRNVWKIEDHTELESKIKSLSAEMLMIQEFVPNTSDIRVIYMHGDIVGAIERSSTDGFHNNVSAGGTTRSIEITEEEKVLSKRACGVLGRSFAGVDVVRTPKGPMLFEVNLGPQIYGFEDATKIDVPLELITRIKNKFF